MAVATHLGIDVADYDARIRTFVPHYETMLDVCAALVDAVAPARALAVDLGTGSGALAARCRDRRSTLRVHGIDADPAMLALARTRLSGPPGGPSSSRGRVQLECADFTRAPLPRCEIVLASLSLHHVETARRKQRVYARIAAALRPGGIFVSADCALPASRALAVRAMGEWRAHLQRSYPAREAAGFLRSWAAEDYYQTLDVELSLLARAGLVPDIAWRNGAFAVLVGTRPTAARPSRRA